MPARSRRRAFVMPLILGVAVLTLVGLTTTAPGGIAVRAAAAASSGDPVIAAVGDFSCDPSDSKFHHGVGVAAACQQANTSSALIADSSIQSVIGLGDFQYDCGDLADYQVSYTPTWGRVNNRMVPVAGNHEYKTGRDKYGSTCPSSNSTATNFFDYFGSAAHPATSGHFSFDIGAWHFIGLNANCGKSGVGGCSATAKQTKWLSADLASSDQPCTAAFWHQPYYTGKGTGKANAYQAWWKVLYAAGVDVVLNGHRHNYQRFAPMNPYGVQTPDGITEYIVGTGGEGLESVSKTAKPAALASHKTFGYSRFTLHPGGWDMQFVNDAGVVLDSSSGTCH